MFNCMKTLKHLVQVLAVAAAVATVMPPEANSAAVRGRKRYLRPYAARSVG